MNEKQKQSVEAGGLAVQSGGDTNISNGVSPDQMREIIESLADQLPKYAQIAASIVDGRLKDFEEKIIRKFEENNEANKDAFGDPDFQYLLLEAQRSYTRSGDEEALQTLGDLLIERSKVTEKSRKKLTLNKAVTLVESLTPQEISELTLTFLIRNVKFLKINSANHLGQILEKFASPFIADISIENNSYLYLESVGCGRLTMLHKPLMQCLEESYPEATTLYKNYDQLIETVEKEFIDRLIGAGILEKIDSQFVKRTIQDRDEFITAISNSGIPVENENDVRAYHDTDGRKFSDEEFRNLIRPHCPSIDRLFAAWNDTPMKEFQISSSGIAIGFVTLSRLTDFNGDINIWLN